MTQDDRLLGLIANAAIKNPCRVASTANLAALSGLLTIDGVTVAVLDRVLVKDQTDPIKNGVYVADTGDWERAKDFDGQYDAVNGTIVKVNAGTVGAGFWYAAGTDPITIGTDSITFSQASSVLAIISAFAQTLLDDTTAAQARTTLGVPSTTEAILQTVGTTKGDVITFTAASTSTRKGVGTNGYRLSANSGDTDGLRYIPPGMGFSLINGYLDWSVAGNVLTCAIKGYDGNDPSATNPVYAWFRDATVTTGSPTLGVITSATSASLSAGSTAGTISATACRIWAVLFNDAGTYRIGLINCLTTVTGAGAGRDVTAIYQLKGWGIASSTAEGGAGAAASAQTFYTGTAVSAKAYAVLGYATFEAGQAAAGTWATAPSREHLFMPGVTPLPGDVIQVQRTQTGALISGSGVTPYDDTIPQITEGDQYMTQAITPTSAANVLAVDSIANVNNGAAGNNGLTVALHQDAIANALAAITTVKAPNYGSNEALSCRLLASTTSATTLRIRAGVSAAGTTSFNGSGGNRLMGGVMGSYLQIEERMA